MAGLTLTPREAPTWVHDREGVERGAHRRAGGRAVRRDGADPAPLRRDRAGQPAPDGGGLPRLHRRRPGAAPACRRLPTAGVPARGDRAVARRARRRRGAPAQAARRGRVPAGRDARSRRGHRPSTGEEDHRHGTDPAGAEGAVRRRFQRGTRPRGGGALGRHRRVAAVARPDGPLRQGRLAPDRRGGRRGHGALRRAEARGHAPGLGGGDGRRRGAPGAHRPLVVWSSTCAGATGSG